MTGDERIELGDLVAEICERLGVHPHQVGELTLTPTEAKALVYLRRDGGKYVDTELGVAACGLKKWRISTLVPETV